MARTLASCDRNFDLRTYRERRFHLRTRRFSVMGLEGVVALVIDQTAEVELRRIAVQMQKMETLGTLAVGLTHDFNNVLNTISMNVALAKGTRDCPDSL